MTNNERKKLESLYENAIKNQKKGYTLNPRKEYNRGFDDGVAWAMSELSKAESDAAFMASLERERR